MSQDKWPPIEIAIPLDESEEHDGYVLHYYSGFNTRVAQSICDKFLTPLVEKYALDPVHVHLFLVDIKHDYTGELVPANCNNGYTVRFGNSNYKIVIFRNLFWPKVLLHEIFHILWFSGDLGMVNCKPKYDESIVEFYAVHYAVVNNYINEAEYKYYLNNTRNTLKENIIKRFSGQEIRGGWAGVAKELLGIQKTHVAEYIFYIDSIMKDNAHDSVFGQCKTVALPN